MSAPKLYRVQMTTVAYVVADGLTQARAIAEHASDMGCRIGQELPEYELLATEVCGERGIATVLADDWETDCVPLGGEGDKTIAELLGADQ